MRLERRSIKRGRVEIIPMIDTILILLVFYMSFSTFTKREKRIDATLPLVSTIATSTQMRLDIHLHVKQQGDVVVNGANTYDLVSLRDTLTQLSAIGQDTAIVIEADPDTSYQNVINVLDTCAQAHLLKVSFRPLTENVASIQ